ncbi:hypothetical protein EX30DRAFT_350331 [Ascodesmis nigricans]|uniref:Uncharacterized protein n=1 Tax=Ascodesmis nigricans TaxID=341454 RepID=A0A4S2MQ88_9PEZI|nr:hypothetical protein EX30DRAFT_350331 [Ascodesmis nigricans]
MPTQVAAFSNFRFHTPPAVPVAGGPRSRGMLRVSSLSDPIIVWSLAPTPRRVVFLENLQDGGGGGGCGRFRRKFEAGKVASRGLAGALDAPLFLLVVCGGISVYLHSTADLWVVDWMRRSPR